jgi:hypothetical protein
LLNKISVQNEIKDERGYVEGNYERGFSQLAKTKDWWYTFCCYIIQQELAKAYFSVHCEQNASLQREV